MADRVLLASGREAEVFDLGDGTVVKLLWGGEDLPRAHQELAACRAVAAIGCPAPVAHGLVTIDGRPGVVMDRIDGTSLLAALERTPWMVLAAGRVMAEVHATIHECPAPAELPDLRTKLRDLIVGAEPLSATHRRTALRVLAGLPDGDRLCHDDLHLGNVLGTWKEPVVIDWAGATRGDPTGDVALTELLHRTGALPPGTPAMFQALASVGRRFLVGQYLRAYRRRRPIDPTLDRWRFVHAAARLGHPVEDEHPTLLALLDRSVGTIDS